MSWGNHYPQVLGSSFKKSLTLVKGVMSFQSCILHPVNNIYDGTFSKKHLTGKRFNPLSASIAVIKEPVNWFEQQINWLVSTCGQH